MMRVLHLVHQYYPERVGGTEMYTRAVTTALARAGHQVSIFHRRFAAGEGLQVRDDAGVTIYSAGSGVLSPARRFLATFDDSAMAHAFEGALVDAQPDLVHIEHLMGFPVELATILVRRRIPFVVTVWDYWWVCANAQLITNYDRQICPGPDRLWLNCARCALARSGAFAVAPAGPVLTPLFALRERRLRDVLRKAAALIAPMPFVKTWYEAHGVPPGRTQVLRPGVEKPAEEIRPRPAHDGIRFAAIGGLSWQKGIHVLVEAFGRLHGDAELWIAGDESFDPAYSGGLCAMAGPRVHFLGVLDRRQVWERLAQVDVVAVPSLWYETLSFIAHEAFVARLPVIASRLGVLADVVRDGVDGLLVTPGDAGAWQAAMQRLVDDPGELRRLRAGVRPPITMDEHLASLTQLYDHVMDQARLTGTLPAGYNGLAAANK
jgi:glycosyltransferase involved in cell wall biosynthesis